MLYIYIYIYIYVCIHSFTNKIVIIVIIHLILTDTLDVLRRVPRPLVDVDLVGPQQEAPQALLLPLLLPYDQ